jgi:hypothetical protein
MEFLSTLFGLGGGAGAPLSLDPTGPNPIGLLGNVLDRTTSARNDPTVRMGLGLLTSATPEQAMRNALRALYGDDRRNADRLRRGLLSDLQSRFANSNVSGVDPYRLGPLY